MRSIDVLLHKRGGFEAVTGSAPEMALVAVAAELHRVDPDEAHRLRARAPLAIDLHPDRVSVGNPGDWLATALGDDLRPPEVADRALLPGNAGTGPAVSCKCRLTRKSTESDRRKNRRELEARLCRGPRKEWTDAGSAHQHLGLASSYRSSPSWGIGSQGAA